MVFVRFERETNMKVHWNWRKIMALSWWITKLNHVYNILIVINDGQPNTFGAAITCWNDEMRPKMRKLKHSFVDCIDRPSIFLCWILCVRIEEKTNINCLLHLEWRWTQIKRKKSENFSHSPIDAPIYEFYFTNATWLHLYFDENKTETQTNRWSDGDNVHLMCSSRPANSWSLRHFHWVFFLPFVNRL